MKTRKRLFLLLALTAACLLGALLVNLLVVRSRRAATASLSTEELINRLADTSDPYTPVIGLWSSAFLPYPDSLMQGPYIREYYAPVESPILEAIIERGAAAVPPLLKHLDDGRETKIPRSTWLTVEVDYYDFNRRTRIDVPPMVSAWEVPSHVITVGDLCFIALGQIVNRNFSPVGGGNSNTLNSPTISKHLCDLARAEFKDFTVEKHRQFLLQDFAKPDTDDRRLGAYRRLEFYYPDVVESVVTKQLSVPTWDYFRVRSFVGGQLYPEKSAAKRKEMFDVFVKTYGPAYSDGARLALFDDLNNEEAYEQNRVSPRPASNPYDARSALIQLYGYKPDVKSADKPFADSWEAGSEAMLIFALTHSKSEKIDAAVRAVLSRSRDRNDYLATACRDELADW